MSETDSTAALPPVIDATDIQENQPTVQKPGAQDFTFTIWPPLQRTRDAIIKRLIDTLTTPSILSKRYGTMPEDEASSAARLIEEEAFTVAGAASSTNEDGIETLQMYSKEIGKRMLEVVKERSASAAAANKSAPETVDGVTAGVENVTIEA